jgi:hypothetical protein
LATGVLAGMSVLALVLGLSRRLTERKEQREQREQRERQTVTG